MEFQADYKHVRPHPNTSPSLGGTVHDNCPTMDVITRGKRIIREDFYCNRQRRYIEPTEGCPFKEGR